MLSILKYLRKPEYVFRPRQVLQRFMRIGKKAPAMVEVTLPWGAKISAYTSENVGLDLYHYGIFDKVVPEAIIRLLDEGEAGVDIGANVGQNCSALAFRTGPEGQVFAFEPHPNTFKQLQTNTAFWPRRKCAAIHLNNIALGKDPGEATLVVTQYLSGASLSSEGEGVKVQVRRLDDFLKNIPSVGVCKIDVEGHELGVLQGATETLKRKGIRDIIFEDFQSQPSAVTQLLQQHGFKVFELHEGWLKPRIETLRDGKEVRPGFSFNFVATLDSDRALARFRRPGWRCL